MKKENRNVVVVFCPPCGENVGLPTKRGFLNKESYLTTPHRPYGALLPQVGKSTDPGFTLIELLVVVLIIGILAAVALPQYQLAVIKARFTQAKITAKTLADAEEIYWLANGKYSTDFQALDVSLTPIRIVSGDGWGAEAYFTWGYCRLSRSQFVQCHLTRSQVPFISYQVAYKHNTWAANRRACITGTTDLTALENRICSTDTQNRHPDTISSETNGTGTTSSPSAGMQYLYK